MMKIFISTLYFLCCTLVVFAQPDFNTERIRERYPYADAFFLTNKAAINISIKDDKLEIGTDYTSDLLFLNDKANLYKRRSIYYYEENEAISNLKAQSYVPQSNGRLRKIEVEETFVDKPRKRGVFYDDLKQIYFDYPSLKQGAVASYSYHEQYKDPHFIAPFFLAAYSPSSKMEYSVTFPKNVSLKYLLKGDTAGIEFSKKEMKNSITYTWQANNRPAYDDEDEEDNWRLHAPHVILYVDKYTVNDKTIPVLSDVKQLYTWYYAHISQLVTANSDAIQLLADSLTRGITDEKQKIKSIYYWVQDHTKYIAFEYGLGGFIPRDAELVYARRYGDCKDKSSLLYALFKSAGIPAYFTWIGTRSIPYSYHELPTPVVDNHMIISLRYHDQWCFLDGTASGLAFGYPSSFIQCKEALIAINADSFVIAKVPVIEKEKNFKTDSLDITFDGTTIKGTGHSSYGGFFNYMISNAFSDVSEKDKQEGMAQSFEFGNNKCKIDSITWKGVNDYSDTAIFNYNVTIPVYTKQIDNKMYVNMHLKKSLQGELIETSKTKKEKQYDYKYILRQITVLTIPSGYNLFKVPENSEYKSGFFGYNIVYHTAGNKVWMEKTISFDTLVKETNQFDDWNKMINKLNDAYSQVVVLQQN
ncbi:MAG: DUF3857 domain-containing protein [Bacteroidia bacterium]